MKRVWKRILELGDGCAEQRNVLTEDEAKEIVLSICQELQVVRPGDYTLDYLSYALARRTWQSH
jgi:hypothetical protein